MSKATVRTLNKKIGEMGFGYGLEVFRGPDRNLYLTGDIVSLAPSSCLYTMDADSVNIEWEVTDRVEDSEISGWLREQMLAGLRDLAKCVFETDDETAFDIGLEHMEDGYHGWIDANGKTRFAGDSLEYRWSSKQGRFTQGPEGWTAVEG